MELVKDSKYIMSHDLIILTVLYLNVVISSLTDKIFGSKIMLWNSVKMEVFIYATLHVSRVSRMIIYCIRLSVVSRGAMFVVAFAFINIIHYTERDVAFTTLGISFDCILIIFYTVRDWLHDCHNKLMYIVFFALINYQHYYISIYTDINYKYIYVYIGIYVYV